MDFSISINIAEGAIIWNNGRACHTVEALTLEETKTLEVISSIGPLYPHQNRHRFVFDDHIYALFDHRANLVKVGRSLNPPSRFKEIKRKLNKFYGYQEGMPYSILLSVPHRIAEVVDVEMTFHSALADAQQVHPAFPMSAEWFQIEAVAQLAGGVAA